VSTGWLTSIDYNDGAADIVTTGYSVHDKVGNRKQRVEDHADDSYDTDWSYTYDEAYQLTKAQIGLGAENYSYDKVGNRLSGPTVVDGPETYDHDDANRMLNGRKLSYTYDELGRQTARIFSNEVDDYAAFEQHWDGAGQLKKVELVRDKGVREVLRRTFFKYDPFGRRVEKKTVYKPDTVPKTVTTIYVYDREDIVYTETDVDGAPPVKTYYIHGPGIDEPLAMVRDGSAYYYHADGLGSIVAITDADMNIVQRYSYESFGRVKASNRAFKDIYAFAGRVWDKEAALYNNLFRYLDPMGGQFISKDPIGFAGGDVNLYRYVFNSPVGWVDPTGKTVYLVSGPSDLPGLAGIPNHHWIMTDEHERGMGLSPDSILDTHWQDHEGRALDENGNPRPGVTLTEMPFVDEEFINQEFERDPSLGYWIPPFNFCWTAANDLLQRAALRHTHNNLFRTGQNCEEERPCD